jgi:transmembrane sensor
VTTVRDEAARWFARMGNAPADHPQRGAFEAWLAAHPAHRAEYAAFGAVWDDFGSAPRADALAGAIEARRASEQRAAEARVASRRRLLRGSALGLGVLGLAGPLGWRLWADWRAQPLLQLALATRTAQQSHQPMPDGSRIVLDARSALSVAYFRDRREVHLQHGEAIFDVARDPQRPFTVHAGAWRVVVVGTRFAVARRGESLRVSVARGRVRLLRAGQPQADALELTAGEVALAAADAPARRVARKAADTMAWERGVLVFDGATLDEIAHRLSRYLGEPVRAEPGEAGPRITAVVQLADIEGFLRNLPAIAPVRVERGADGVLLAPRGH